MALCLTYRSNDIVKIIIEIYDAYLSCNKPNLVFIFADDMEWSDAGYQGFKTTGLDETPNIKRLATEGMILNRFYLSAANCALSIVCLLTGIAQGLRPDLNGHNICLMLSSSC